MCVDFEKRRDVLVEGLNSIPNVTCRKPVGAFYVFPNISKTGWDDRDLARAILDEVGVAVLAGTAFGPGGEGYLRLSYANSIDNIRTAIERIGTFLNTAVPA